MSNTNRLTLNFPANTSAIERLMMFISFYDVRLFTSDRCWMDFGCGSLGVFSRCYPLYEPIGYSGSLGSVGRWCEVGRSATIMGRGDHANHLPVNVSLQTLRMFSGTTEDFGMMPPQKISIGNGVLISDGALIMTGVSIGDGAVVGAGSVVTRDVPPRSIVVGAPAKVTSERQAFAPWWDFDLTYLLVHMRDGDLQAVAASDGPHPFQTDRPRFALRHDKGSYSLIGFMDGDTVRPMNDAPARVREFMAQAVDPSVAEAWWVPDCWAD